MAIVAGSDILASDFTSVGGSAGKGVVCDGAGKIDPSFLYPVIPSIKAYANVSAGNILKSIAGQVAAITGIPTQSIQNTGTSIYADAIYDVCYLNATTVVVFFDNVSSGNIRYYSVVAGTISGQTITWGAVVQLQTENQGSSPRATYAPLKVTPVSTTCFVASFNTDAYSGGDHFQLNAYVCTVSGNTITAGSMQTMGTTAGYSIIDACSPSNDTFMVSMIGQSTAYPYAVAGTVNESTRAISAGTILQVTSSYSIISAHRVHLLSSNRMLLTYWQNTTTMYYAVVTLSGTTLTRVTYDQANPGGLASTGRFIQGSISNAGLYVSTSCYYLSESGGTITLGVNTTPVNGSGINTVCLYDSTSNVFIVQTSTSNTVAMVQCSSSGCILLLTTKITGGALGGLSSNGVQQFAEIEPVYVSGTNYLGTVIGSLDWILPIGFAKSTISSGNAVLVNITGQMEQNQSGLFPGLDYYANASGGITANPTTTINTISFTNKKIGRAYSTTALAVSI